MTSDRAASGGSGVGDDRARRSDSDTPRPDAPDTNPAECASRPPAPTARPADPHATRPSLLDRIAGDRGDAWLEFQDRYADLVRSVARRAGLQAADVEDVLQLVLLTLTRRMRGSFEYDPQRGRFRGYLRTLTINAVRDRLRETHRRRSAHEQVAGDAHAARDEDGMDATWESEWRAHHVRLAMRRLESEFSERDLAAFTAYAMHGRDARRTAEVLGMSIEQVYQAKSRLLRRLAELVAAQVEDEG